MGKLRAGLLCACAVSANALAAPGDILYVQGKVANMREGPSTQRPIVLQLERGQQLLEFQRKGNWVEVGADRTGGKSGWIHSSLVGNQLTAGGPSAPSADAKFQRFQAAFDALNASVEQRSGVRLFTKAENLGDGMVQVTATDRWLNAPRADQKSSLKTVFQMWDAADGSGLPIAVYVVDERGNQRMSMKR